MSDFLLTLFAIIITTCLLRHSKHNEKQLLLRIAAGDAAAFSALFYTYHQTLAAYILRLTKSPIIAEEIVQDTFIKLWEKRSQLATVDNFHAYLFTISRNHTFNCMRD